MTGRWARFFCVILSIIVFKQIDRYAKLETRKPAAD